MPSRFRKKGFGQKGSRSEGSMPSHKPIYVVKINSDREHATVYTRQKPIFKEDTVRDVDGKEVYYRVHHKPSKNTYSEYRHYVLSHRSNNSYERDHYDPIIKKVGVDSDKDFIDKESQ